MDNDQIVQEVKEMMADRGYDLDTAVKRVANVAGMTSDEVREIYDDSQG